MAMNGDDYYSKELPPYSSSDVRYYVPRSTLLYCPLNFHAYFLTNDSFLPLNQGFRVTGGKNNFLRGFSELQ